MRENIGLSAAWTPEAGYYWEAGYSLSEVFLVANMAYGPASAAHHSNQPESGLSLRIRIGLLKSPILQILSLRPRKQDQSRIRRLTDRDGNFHFAKSQTRNSQFRTASGHCHPPKNH
jgi:hypothetical protein